jgi:formamidopyrimidine-DNA glycosylase
MPELPEVEALRRALDDPVRAYPIEHAGPAHIATLKTFDPPLSVLAGQRLAGAERRAKRLLFPTEDGELVLLIHLMSAGRVRYLRAGEKGPKTPAFRLRFEGGGQLVLTEGGPKKRAGVWLLTPEAVEAELEHLGPEALGLGAERLGEILAGQPRRLHSLLRDQRVIAGIGRSWVDEILWRAKLSAYKRGADLDADEALRLREAVIAALGGALAHYEANVSLPIPDKLPMPLAIHRHEGEPCPRCGEVLKAVHFEDYVIAYCPTCQTEGRVLKDRRLSRLLR